MSTTATPTRRFDGWVRHPAAFSFRALDVATEAAHVPVGGRVVDPFTGSGRAATFITGRGDRFIGIEAHPLMADFADVKLCRPGPPEELRSATEELVARAGSVLTRVNLGREQSLVRQYMPHDALRGLIALRDCVPTVDGPWRRHLQWLVLSALRDAAGKSWPYMRRAGSKASGTDPFMDVRRRATVIADDLAAAPREPDGRVICGDSRTAQAWSSIPAGTVQASVSSPPYLNQVSYAEVTRLEVHFLGWVRSWKEMAEYGRSMVAACTQQVDTARARHAALVLAQYPGTAALVATLCRRLERARVARRGRKYYERLLPAYFADIAAVLEHLKTALEPGARACWVIGDSAPYDVRVDTPYLVAALAEELGLEVLDDVHLVHRGHKWRNVRARPARSLSERLVVFRRPYWGRQEALPGFEDYPPVA